ncbi:MAG TPA: BrnA antitoxin family protein [Acetobacteraceae bacterium]|nr:BrnA antitoxin family protein [Acetobacteraceae bacterium]
MSQAEVERLADEEDGTRPEGWESTVEPGMPERRQAIHIRVDPEVLRWFKAHGPGYQTRINAVLQAFVQARRRSEALSASRPTGI